MEQLMEILAMLKNQILLIVLILILVNLNGCKKEDNISDKSNILGKWTTFDKSLSLYFFDNSNLYKYGERESSDLKMDSEHYDYHLDNDSITIGYSGKLYIYIIPTKHKYQLIGDTLAIDFSNTNCFGFDQKAIKLVR
jgi:hypothetical protein